MLHIESTMISTSALSKKLKLISRTLHQVNLADYTWKKEGKITKRPIQKIIDTTLFLLLHQMFCLWRKFHTVPMFCFISLQIRDWKVTLWRTSGHRHLQSTPEKVLNKHKKIKALDVIPNIEKPNSFSISNEAKHVFNVKQHMSWTK